MINAIKINFNKLDLLALFLIFFLPIFILTGSLLININVILLDLIFLFNLLKNKELKYLENKFFYFFVILWMYIIFNLFFFSIDFNNSVSRSVGLIRFIIFAFAVNYYIFYKFGKIKNYILNFWVGIFLFITVDLIFEFTTGFNLFGFKSPFSGRLAGVLKDELKIGHFYFAFLIIILCQILKNIKIYNLQKNYTFLKYVNLYYLIFIIFILTSLMIGERSNFLKVIFVSIIFFLLIDKKKILKKISLLCFTFIIAFILILNNSSFKLRFLDTFLIPLSKNPIQMISETTYGSHYKAAIKIHKEYPIFGVGLKNYRVEVSKNKYGKLTSIHPHQIHFEILSELGLIGYLLFITIFLFVIFKSIILYIKNNDPIRLGGILFLIATFLPLLPSGSFFTTYGAILFWMNIGFILPRVNSKF